MPRDLRFGILAPQIVPFDVQVQRWRELDTFGFDSLWLADHFVNPNMPSGRWFEAWTLLAAAASHTRRIRLGALVTSITYRHPAILAKEALTVDHISSGRLELGVGAAGAPNDYVMPGLDAWEAPERVRRFREVVHILDLMLRNQVSSYEGRYYRVLDAVMAPGPAQKPRPPFTLAAHGPTALKIAARYADTWNCSAGGGGRGERPRNSEECVAGVRALNERFEAACAAVGRDPAPVHRSILAGGGVTPDNPWASIEAFQDFVGRYREAGINEFIFYYPSRAEQAPGHYERIAREVLPALKREAVRDRDPA